MGESSSLREYLLLTHISGGKRTVLFLFLGCQFVLALTLGLPGHLSTDSLIQLYEGRNLEFISFNPPLMSILLGLFDQLGHAPALFVLLSTLLLSISTWLAVASATRQFSSLRLVVVPFLILNPILLLYSGIVWKDVLLAHSIILAFLLPDLLTRTRGMAQYTIVGVIWLLLIIVIGIRQQGILFALPLALWTAWRLSERAWMRASFALVLFIGAIVVNSAVSDFALERKVGGDPPGLEVGLKILMRYDMIGMLSNGASPPEEMNPATHEEMAPEVSKYSSYRVDTLDGPSPQFWSQSLGQTAENWLGHIADSPVSYLKHRLMVTLRILGVGDMWQCLPYHRGVSSHTRVEEVNQDLASFLGIESTTDHFSQQINDFVRILEHTPFYRHWFYVLVALGLSVWFYRQRDWIPLTLLGCTLAYISSYSVIGIACDFRYGYTLTIVVTVLAVRALLMGRNPEEQKS